MAIQLSVFLENKVGNLRKVTATLKKEQINIRSMTLSTTPMGWGIFNLVVSQPDRAYQALHANGVTVALREIIVIPIPDKPGGIDEMLEKIESAGINLENAYARLVEEGKTGHLVLDVEEVQDVKEKIENAGIKILSDKEVYNC